MEKINFQDGITKGNAETFNTMQDNVENAINETKMKTLEQGYNIDNITQSGVYGIFNATGTLPSVFSDDNNIFIECFRWSDNWSRQMLYDIRTNGGIYTRILVNGVWTEWLQIATN